MWRWQGAEEVTARLEALEVLAADIDNERAAAHAVEALESQLATKVGNTAALVLALPSPPPPFPRARARSIRGPPPFRSLSTS